MWSLALAVLANVGGLLTAAFALLLFTRSTETGQANLGTRRWLAVLTLLGAGGLLATTGQYKLIRSLYHQATKAEAPGRLLLLLQEPVESLVLQVSDPDPFADPVYQCSLRLRVSTNGGATFVSEIPKSELKVPPAGKHSESYRITRQSLLRGIRTEENRAVAAGLLLLKDWRQVEHIEAELVTSNTQDRLPARLTVLILEAGALGFREAEALGFQGEKTVESTPPQSNSRLASYRDATPLADRFTEWTTSYMPAGDDELGSAVGAGLVVGVLCLIFGIGLLAGTGYAGPQRSSFIPTAPDVTSSPLAPIPPTSLPGALELQDVSSRSGPLAALELKKATGLRINYSVQNKTKSLMVDDPGQVRTALASLVITGEDKKIGTQYFPLGTIDFLVPDKEEIKTKFISATHLEKDNWGQLYVTEDFYLKVCELLSKAEGRPMDILANNR